jgi:membrane associated rhomboid family serine protease
MTSSSSRLPLAVTQLRGGGYGRPPWDQQFNDDFFLHRGQGKVLIDRMLALPPVIQAIVVANVVVFLAWQTLPSTFMVDNFAETKANLSKKKLWNLLTYAFSHINVGHLVANMAVLTTFGPGVLEKLRPQLFVGVVIVSAVFAGAVSALLRPFGLSFRSKQRREVEESRVMLGFSGVNTALIFLYAVLHPWSDLSIADFPPMPARQAVQALMALDVTGLLLGLTVCPTVVSHSTHVGGYLAAFLIQLFLCHTSFGKRFATRRQRSALSIPIF